MPYILNPLTGEFDYYSSSIIMGAPISGGTDKQVLFNDGGVVGGKDAFKFDKTTNTLSIGAAGDAVDGQISVFNQDGDLVAIKVNSIVFPEAASIASPSNEALRIQAGTKDRFVANETDAQIWSEDPISFNGRGTGFNEKLSLDLNTGSGGANTAEFTSSTGVIRIDYTNIGILRDELVLLVHSDNTTTPFNASADTDAARGAALFAAGSAMASGDTLLIGPGTFDMDGGGTNHLKISMPSGSTIRGCGRATILKSTKASGSSGLGLIFPASNCTIQDLYFDNSGGSFSNIAYAIGRQGGSSLTIQNVRIINCGFNCKTDGIFFEDMTGTSNISIDVINCYGTTAWDIYVFSLSSSSGTMNIRMFDCTAVATGNSGHAGFSSAALRTASDNGAVTVELYNCDFSGSASTGTLVLINGGSDFPPTVILRGGRYSRSGASSAIVNGPSLQYDAAVQFSNAPESGSRLAIWAGDVTNNGTNITSTKDINVPDEAYGSAWNGSLEVPTKNAIYDKIETIASDVLFDHFTDAGNTGTGEDDLYSDTISAGQLSANGQKIVATYQGVFSGAAASTQDLRIYFGGTKIYDSGALSIGVATNSWTAEITLIRVSSSVVRCSVAISTDFATLFPYSKYTEVTGLTLSNTQILKLTGEAAGVGAGDNQVVAKLGYVQYVPQA